MSVGTENLASLLDGVGEQVEDRLGVFPVDTGIGDADTVFEAGFALRGYLLVTFTKR